MNETVPKYYPKMSPLQFLEWERDQEYKHEYVNGEVLAMSGASVNHNRVFNKLFLRVASFFRK